MGDAGASPNFYGYFYSLCVAVDNAVDLGQLVHEVLLVLDGSTGQNAFQQAKEFARATDISALAITKLDGTAKGGVVVAISDELELPVLYVGVGEKIDDMQEFVASEFVQALFE